jgi:hypothetical protein
MHAWAEEEASPALRAATARLVELDAQWAQAQAAMTAVIKEQRRVFEAVLAREKATDTARQKLLRAEADLAAAEESSAAQRAKSGVPSTASEARLLQARASHAAVDAELGATRVDTERFKVLVDSRGRPGGLPTPPRAHSRFAPGPPRCSTRLSVNP